MACAVGGAALGLLPAAISFALGVLASMAFRTLPLRSIYDSIDWPVIVLLGALIPVAGAMESTGTADLIARALARWRGAGQRHRRPHPGAHRHHDPVRPDEQRRHRGRDVSDRDRHRRRARGQRRRLPDGGRTWRCSRLPDPDRPPEQHPDPRPGGFRFGDYWRLGLPLELLVAAVSIPLILLVWPL